MGRPLGSKNAPRATEAPKPFTAIPGEPGQVTGDGYMGNNGAPLALKVPIVHDRVEYQGETAIVLSVDANGRKVSLRTSIGDIEAGFDEVARK